MVKKYKVGKHISQDPDLILEEQLLLSPGMWGGVNFTKEEIIKGLHRTDWENKENNSIIRYHPKKGELPTADAWIGELKNVRYLTLEEGVSKEGMYADAYLYDPILAKKIAYGKARLAFSIDSPYKLSRTGATDLYFSKTAMVYRPGCKDAYIQLSEQEDNLSMRFISDELEVKLEGEITSEESKGNEGIEYSNEKTKIKELEEENKYEEDNEYLDIGEIVDIYDSQNELILSGEIIGFTKENEIDYVILMDKIGEIKLFNYEEYSFEKKSEEEINLEKVTAMEEKRKELGLSVSEFYAVPRDPPSNSALPIFDENHVRNAMARFNQTNFETKEEKIKARAKIIRKANYFEIDTSGFKESVKLEFNIKLKCKKRKQLEDTYISKKEELEKIKNEKTFSSIQLEDSAEQNTPIQTLEKVEPQKIVEQPVVVEKQPEVKIEKEIVDNSNEIKVLKETVSGFKTELDEFKNSILEALKSKTEEVKKPSQPRTSAYVEDNSTKNSELTPFEKAFKKLNSK